MRAGEKKALREVMNQAFPFFMRLYFSFTGTVLVAEKNGELVGGVILKLFLLPGRVKAGVISFIFCAPALSGLGIGRTLAEAGIKALRKEGCTELFACVEGDNTSSARLFRENGFTRLSLFQQLRFYGLKSFLLAFHSAHLSDIGFFLWAKSIRNPHIPQRPASAPWTEWAFTVCSHIIIFLLFSWRQGDDHYLEVGSLLALVLMLITVNAVRTAAMLGFARTWKVNCEFRMWDSGIFFSAAIALLFGGFLPTPGSCYPAGDDWKHKNYIKLFGLMALCSSVCLLAVTWSIVLLIGLNAIPAPWQNGFETALLIGTALLLVDVTLPFFPFSPFNGRRLWDWNRAVWLALSCGAVPLLAFI